MTPYYVKIFASLRLCVKIDEDTVKSETLSLGNDNLNQQSFLVATVKNNIPLDLAS